MDVICTNDKFSDMWELYFSKYGIQKPVEGKLYTIRKVVKHTQGGNGLLLNGIINGEFPKISFLTGEKGIGETDFSVSRFAHLNGTPLTEEEVRELARNEKKEKEFVKITPKTNNPYDN